MPSCENRRTVSEPIKPADPVTIIVRTGSMVSGNFPADENLSQGGQAPFHFFAKDLEPSDTRGRPLIGTCHASWIQEQNAASLFVSRHVGMTVQDNVDLTRRNIRRNMLEPKFQSTTLKIDEQGPFRIPIAIPAHHSDSRADCAQVIEDRWFADVAQMPDLVRIRREIENFLRQLVMRVGENKNSKNTSHLSLNKAGTAEGENHF